MAECEAPNCKRKATHGKRCWGHRPVRGKPFPRPAGQGGLNRADRLELVDLLRKNMLYQTPNPVFAHVDEEHPTHVEMRFVFKHQQRILQLIHKAGGWVLPPDEQQKILERHEKASRVAYGDGVNYDFSHLDYGALVEMHAELEGVDEFKPFRDAIEAELAEWQNKGNDG